MASLRYDVLRLEDLIRRYVNSKGDAPAKIDLINMIIEGEDLTDALDNLEFETEEEIKENKDLRAQYEEKCEEYTKIEKEYKELQAKYEELEKAYDENIIEDIKRLIEGKQGPFVDKIRDIL